MYGHHGRETGSFVVDDADAPAVNQWRWHLGSKGYVIRTEYVDGKKITVRLHRWLMGLSAGDPRQVDHRDGDPSNNRRSNLRVTSRAGNAQNRKAARSSRSGIRGVYRRRETRSKPWVVQLRVDGRLKTVGYFASAEEATAVAEATRREHQPMSVAGR